MQSDLISKATRNAFREYLVQAGVIRTIWDLFEAEGIAFREDFEPPVSGERRGLVECFYASIDFGKWQEVRSLLNVYEAILNGIPESDPDFDQLRRFLVRDGFKYEDGKIMSSSHILPSMGMAREVAQDFNASIMRAQIQRIEASIYNDPDLAIGSAKELVETCCKTILDDRSVQYNKNADMSELVKTVQRELRLLPEDIPDSAKGAKSIRRLLSNLGDLVRGMSEVRNLYGSGHGPHGRARRVKPRHAMLVVGAATTLVVFLYETHIETSNTD